MTKHGSLKSGDRVKVTLPNHIYENQFGNIHSRDTQGGTVMHVQLDGMNLPVPIYEIDLTKVAPNAGKPKPEPVTLSNEEKMYMLGCVALTELRNNPDPESFMRVVRSIAEGMGELA